VGDGPGVLLAVRKPGLGERGWRGQSGVDSVGRCWDRQVIRSAAAGLAWAARSAATTRRVAVWWGAEVGDGGRD